MFNAPSPRNSNRAKLYLNSRGELLDRNGAYWGRSQIMAMDAALKPRRRKLAFDDVTPSGPKKPPNLLAAKARNDIASAVKEFCSATGMEPGQLGDQITDLIDEAERTQIQEYAASLGGPEGAGKGALDRDDDVDEGAVEERVREFLRGKGLADDDIEEAIEKVRRDREEARDSRPENAIHGGRGGRFSGAVKDAPTGRYPGIAPVMDEYPNNLLDMPDYGPDPDRFRSGYDPATGRVSRRQAGDAASGFDEETERLIAAVKVGVWG